ncbi:MAG: hypothetical protein BGO62_05170 [Thiobacillus sp. 65-1402]|nr:MAG: hypothetical protein BGO62_05170 [Thiobacillus sp. 65-1402]
MRYDSRENVIAIIDNLLTSGGLAVICPQPAGADRPTAPAAGARTARVRKNPQRPVGALQLRGLRLPIMRAPNRSKLLRQWADF